MRPRNIYSPFPTAHKGVFDGRLWGGILELEHYPATQRPVVPILRIAPVENVKQPRTCHLKDCVPPSVALGIAGTVSRRIKGRQMEPVKVDLLDNGGSLAWSSFGDVDQWVKQEEKYWEWLIRPDHRLNIVQDVRSEYVKRYRELRAFGENPPDPESALDQCRRHCESQFAERLTFRWEPVKTRKLPTSTSAIAKYVTSLIHHPLEGPDDKPDLDAATDRFALAGSVLYLHCNGEISNAGNWGRIASAAQTLYGHWLAGVTLPQFDISRVDALSDSLLKNIEASTSSAAKQLSEIKSTQSDCVGDLERHRKSFDKTLEDHRKTIAGIQDAYRKEMALRKPVEYWADRGKEHREGAQYWLAASALSSVAILMVLIGLATALWPDTKQVIYEMKSIGGVENVTAAIVGQLVLASAAKFAVVAGIAVWWLRICVRNYLSHVHLARDASERVAVIKSLIAMSTDEELRHLDGIKEEGLKIALQNVFRHASDGVVKDDGLPATNLLQVFRGDFDSR